MFLPRRLLPCAACLLLLLSACTGVTEITALDDGTDTEAADTDEPTELALVEDLPTGAAVPTAEPTAEVVEPVDTTPVEPEDVTIEPEDWVYWDIDDAYGIEVPGYMETRLWFTDELKLFVEESKDVGLTFPRQLVSEYDQILKTPQGIVFFGPDGDALTAHRSFGAANELVYHEKTADDLTLQYNGFASNVNFSSEPRLFGETPGVLFRGTYDVEDARWYYYSFHTHFGAYLYYFTVALTGDDDPEMVADYFRSVVISG